MWLLVRVEINFTNVQYFTSLLSTYSTTYHFLHKKTHIYIYIYFLHSIKQIENTSTHHKIALIWKRQMPPFPQMTDLNFPPIALAQTGVPFTRLTLKHKQRQRQKSQNYRHHVLCVKCIRVAMI